MLTFWSPQVAWPPLTPSYSACPEGVRALCCAGSWQPPPSPTCSPFPLRPGRVHVQQLHQEGDAPGSPHDVTVGCAGAHGQQGPAHLLHVTAAQEAHEAVCCLQHAPCPCISMAPYMPSPLPVLLLLPSRERATGPGQDPDCARRKWSSSHWVCPWCHAVLGGPLCVPKSPLQPLPLTTRHPCRPRVTESLAQPRKRLVVQLLQVSWLGPPLPPGLPSHPGPHLGHLRLHHAGVNTLKGGKLRLQLTYGLKLHVYKASVKLCPTS